MLHKAGHQGAHIGGPEVPQGGGDDIADEFREAAPGGGGEHQAHHGEQHDDDGAGQQGGKLGGHRLGHGIRQLDGEVFLHQEAVDFAHD